MHKILNYYSKPFDSFLLFFYIFLMHSVSFGLCTQRDFHLFHVTEISCETSLCSRHRMGERGMEGGGMGESCPSSLHFWPPLPLPCLHLQRRLLWNKLQKSIGVPTLTWATASVWNNVRLTNPNSDVTLRLSIWSCFSLYPVSYKLPDKGMFLSKKACESYMGYWYAVLW